MANYKTFAKPFSKVFLGAVLTYQLLYWTWLKLETDESKLEKNGMGSSPDILYCFLSCSCLVLDKVKSKKSGFLDADFVCGRGNVESGEEGSGAGRCSEVKGLEG